MSTHGDRLGQGDRARVGVGVSVRPQDVPVETWIPYSEWREGLITAESPENIPKDSAINLIDTEVDLTDALVRAPGITLDQDIAPRKALWVFQQAAVDFSTELVVIDPPWLGYKSVAGFTFNNLGLPATSIFGWAAADVAGTLIFSDGLTKTYTRLAGSNLVTDISGSVIAQCFATAFGRVFAGAFKDAITGIQSLGVMWNAASASISDWVGLGSGAEFLISNNELADRVVAIVPIGLQTMGILCRKSLWAGYQTGVSNRPADFQIRFPGAGCVSRETAVATPGGVCYLSDDGVRLFDLNDSKVISQAIDSLLLPLNYASIGQYRAAYNESTQEYVLNTPTGVFVYEFPHGRIPGRWFFRSFISDSVVIFTNQSGGVYWNSVVGLWNLQTLTWAAMVIGQNNAPSLTYFGKGTKLGYEDAAAVDNMGVAQNPLWITRQDNPDFMEITETHWFEIQYRSMAPADVTLTCTDTNGDLTNAITKTLPNTNGLRKKLLIGVSTMAGMGTTMQINFGATAVCAIEGVRRAVMPAGLTMGSTI